MARIKEQSHRELNLGETRKIRFEKFRRNLYVLYRSQDKSAEEQAKIMGLRDGKRILHLIRGQGHADVDELMRIANYYSVSLDDLLNKTAEIHFV